MSALDDRANDVVQGLGSVDEASSPLADEGPEWKHRAEGLQRSLRLLQWMAVTAVVLAATLLFRVFTH